MYILSAATPYRKMKGSLPSVLCSFLLYCCVVRAAAAAPTLLTLHAIGGDKISAQRQSELAAAMMALDSDSLDQLLVSSGVSSMCIVGETSVPTSAEHRTTDKLNPDLVTLYQISWLKGKKELLRLQSFLDTASTTYGIYWMENIARPHPINVLQTTERIGLETINARPGDDIVVIRCSSVLDVALWDLLVSNGTEILIRHDVLQAYGTSRLDQVTGQVQSIVIHFGGTPGPSLQSANSISPKAKYFLEYFRTKVESAVTISPDNSKKARRSDFNYHVYRCLACVKFSSGFLYEIKL